jgi:hypothetical protein
MTTADDKGAYESAKGRLNGKARTLLVKNARNYPKWLLYVDSAEGNEMGACPPPWVSGSNGTKNRVKLFSLMDSLDSSRVKSDCGHHHRGVAPEVATRATTDRPVKDRHHPL